MKSIKPGRGPSKMSFAGSIAAIVFGIFWTIMAFAITSGARGIGGFFSLVGIIFPLFGIVFVILGIVQAVYHYRNAHSKDRYSIFDITEDREEGDPSDPAYRNRTAEPENFCSAPAAYCPYCGEPISGKDYRFCPHCGKSIR